MSARVKQSSRSSADKHANKDVPSTEQGANEKINPQWKLLSHEQINTLLDLTVEDLQLQLEDKLGFKNYQTCLKEAALLDYFVSGFWWAKEMNFTCQQISFVMAVLQLLLDNIREKQMPFVDNFHQYAKAIAGTRQSPAPEVDASPLFDTEQAMAITDYLKCSLFQDYKLYEFLFTHPREELLLGMERTIEVISSSDVVAPLEEGMQADVYFCYMAPPPVEQQEEVMNRNQEEDETNETELQKGDAFEGYTIEDVNEVLGEMTTELLGNLQIEFTEKLRVQEETYSARLERLKNDSLK